MLLIPTADLFHCIISACEVLHLVFIGGASFLEAARFFSIVVVGNTVGGVVLVGLLNYGQTSDARQAAAAIERTRLSWQEFLGLGR